jgi:formylmethanofuran--tetrahydromethanopterin N-formyltransferase
MVIIEDTFAEAFDGLYSRILITAERGLNKRDRERPELEYDELRFAAYRSTSTPSTVVGRIEGGIEKWLSGKETPDGREGVVVQFWSKYDEREQLEKQVDKFYKEMSIRIRQDILSVPTTRVFNWLNPKDAIYNIDAEERIGRCGGGYEWIEEKYGRKMIKIPLMMGYDFEIDEKLGCGIGISGANLWFFCRDVEAGRRAGRKAIEAINKLDGVITSFYVCPSGSMVRDYPPIGPPTNYPFCPTLREKIGKESKVPEGVNSIPEIVINGISMSSVKHAMKNAIYAVKDVKGVLKISAGNYEGKLGRHKIYLRELVPELFVC